MTTCHLSSIRTRVYRAATFLTVLSLLAATAAQAQGRRARLSDDLAKKLEQGDASTTSVIVSGSQARALAVAARHGLRVKTLLETGAVLDVPAGRLAALAADAGVDALSSDQDVKSTMALTNTAIGAELLQTAGAVATNLGAVTGKGVGVAVIDSGVAIVPQLARPRPAAQGLHRCPPRQPPRPVRARHARGRHHRRRVAAPVRRDHRGGAGSAHHQPEGARRQRRRQGQRRDSGHRLRDRQQERSSTSR